MVSLVSLQEVRDISGAPVTLIDDIQMQSIIDEVELKTKDLYGIEFTPTKKVEILTGEWKDKILVDEYFPLTAIEVRNGDTVMDLSNIYVHPEEGFLEIYGDSIIGNYSNRFSGYDLQVKLKYLYGIMQKDNSVQAESTATISSGASVVVTVDDATGFTVNDWVFLEDMNRSREVSKITAINSNDITFNNIYNDYEADTIITKAKTHEIIRQFVLYECALAVAVHAIGSTYTIATGYNIEGVSVQVGVPYTHWLNNFDRNQKLRDKILPRIKSLLGAIV